ncbi:MAG TPA: hypothetical protein VJN88_07630, partial [Ktedonobacterales bacterium]|nr:hypothetical protein [Ktedonobacterales bacterium]
MRSDSIWTRLSRVAPLLTLVALLAACGQSVAGNSGKPAKATVTTRASVTATVAVSPTPSRPYSFPARWRPATGFDDIDADKLSHHIGSIVFSPTTPAIGYACAVKTSNPAAARPHAEAPTHPLSGVPTLFKTTDGGATWTTIFIPFSQSVTCQLYMDQADANDVVAAAGSDPSGSVSSLTLYRTTDGARFWNPVTLPTAQGYQLSLRTLVVTQSRLIAFMGEQGEGRLPTPLYASDDSGASWQVIGQSILNQHLYLDKLWTMGATLVLASDPGCQGPCGTARPRAAANGFSALTQPFAGQPPIPTVYFKSTDNGATWAKMTLPNGNYQSLFFTRAASGSNYYGVALSAQMGSQGVTSTIFYTSDSGATWTALPSVQGAENGYLDPGTIGQRGIAIAPDGSVVAGMNHMSPIGATDGGAF